MRKLPIQQPAYLSTQPLPCSGQSWYPQIQPTSYYTHSLLPSPGVNLHSALFAAVAHAAAQAAPALPSHSKAPSSTPAARPQPAAGTSAPTAAPGPGTLRPSPCAAAPPPPLPPPARAASGTPGTGEKEMGQGNRLWPPHQTCALFIRLPSYLAVPASSDLAVLSSIRPDHACHIGLSLYLAVLPPSGLAVPRAAHRGSRCSPCVLSWTQAGRKGPAAAAAGGGRPLPSGLAVQPGA